MPRKTRPAPMPRPKPELEPLRKSALTVPMPTTVAGTPRTPRGDVAAFLTPLDAISNGPNIPVLRYLVERAVKTKDNVVSVDRAEIAKAVFISERHVSRALAVLLDAEFIERVAGGDKHHTYKVNTVLVAPSQPPLPRPK